MAVKTFKLLVKINGALIRKKYISDGSNHGRKAFCNIQVRKIKVFPLT
jgi:hypothetical protein